MVEPLLQQERLFQLWDDLSEYPLLKTEAALLHLLESVCDWLKADDGLWLPAIRPARMRENLDYAQGWRTPVFRRKMLPIPKPLDQLIPEPKPAAPMASPMDIGMTTKALIETAGKFRYYRYNDGFIDVKAFERTEHYRQYYASRGISDRIWVVFPLGEDAESIFCFDRMGGADFTVQDAELAALALRGIRWFHQKLFLSHGMHIVEKAFTATQREIVLLLLTDKSEKEIAQLMGRSLHTVHEHVKAIYRALGVGSRAGLMALWLRSR
jgi:DNA-binding CsgD family transcriptional regulator